MSDKLTIRCYAERKDGLWIAVCPQFTLATQGDTYEEAKGKLESQIQSYIVEALTIDRQHAGDLLSRKAPLQLRWKYTLARIKSHFGQGLGGYARTFLEPIPVLYPEPKAAA